MNNMILTIILIFTALLNTSCISSDGLSPGEGPGFSIFDPAISGEELYDALIDIRFSESEVLSFASGNEVMKQCSLGGTVKLKTPEIQYINCSEYMNIREVNYKVVVNGTNSTTVKLNQGYFGQLSYSVSGDLGFSVSCDYEKTASTDEIKCTFLDNDGQQLQHEGIWASDPS